MLVISILFFSPVISQTKGEDKSSFENQEAWLWYIKPVTPKIGVCLVSDTLVLLLKNKGASGIDVFMTGFDKMNDIIKLQAIAFDDSDKRYQFSSGGWSSSGDAWIRIYHLSTQLLPWEKIKYIGNLIGFCSRFLATR